MSFRLRLQNDTQRTLSFTRQTWHALLDLAYEYGWNPVGTVVPEWAVYENPAYVRERGFVQPYEGSYTAVAGGRLVILDDALNLSDALELAFIDYEPVRVPRYSDFLFDSPWNGRREALRPSLGALTEMIDFCQNGAFWIEQF